MCKIAIKRNRGPKGNEAKEGIEKKNWQRNGTFFRTLLVLMVLLMEDKKVKADNDTK